MKKIDFFGGLHGNYLELVINVFIEQNGFKITKSMFNQTGACHIKDHCPDYQINVKSMHWTSAGTLPDSDDIIIQIVPSHEDMLIGLTNSFLRAGDQVIDLTNFEKNTIEKLTANTKTEEFAQQIINDFGYHKNYSRANMRNYFYAKLSDPEHGHKEYSTFFPTQLPAYQFPFRSFFNIIDFTKQLNHIAHFLNQNFYPDASFYNLYDEFIKYNQGLKSEHRCKEFLTCILYGQQIDMSLNIIEEAWINYQLAEIFRCYDHPLLMQDQYPTDSLVIANAINEWKSIS